MIGDAVQQVLRGFENSDAEVVGLWMAEEEGVEEKREERAVRKLVESEGKHTEYRLWADEKYFIDEYGPSRCGERHAQGTLQLT